MTVAGLRYAIAAGVPVPLLIRVGTHRAVRRLDRNNLGDRVGLGVRLYAVTYGAQFVVLKSLTSAVNLLVTVTSVIVALLGVSLRGERTSG